MSDEPRLSVNQFMVPELELVDLARWCRSRDVRGLGVLCSTAETLGPSKVRAVLAQHGVLPTSLCVALGIFHPDREKQAERQNAAMRAAELATSLEVPLVVVVGGVERGVTIADARERAIDAMVDLSAWADRIGAQLLIEPLHPAMVQLSALTTLEEAISLSSGLANVGVVLDSWHLWTDPHLTRTIRERPHEVSIVHLSDSDPEAEDAHDRTYPGHGLIDLVGLVRLLRSTGFDGWWELEVLSGRLRRTRSPTTLLDESVEAARQMFAKASLSP